MLIPVGEHKGYGLALVMEILSGVISGSAFGSQIGSLYDFSSGKTMGLGHFMMAINIGALLDPKIFFQRLEDLIEEICSSEKIDEDNPIVLPGEIEEERKIEQLNSGVLLKTSVISELKELATELDISVAF